MTRVSPMGVGAQSWGSAHGLHSCTRDHSSASPRHRPAPAPGKRGIVPLFRPGCPPAVTPNK